MAVYGKLDEFMEGTDWSEYVERLEQYFVANDIQDRLKQRSIFLTCVGAKTYGLIRSLVAPEKPSSCTYAQLVETVRKHLCPKALVIAERFKFHNFIQKEGMCVRDYLTHIRKLSETCNFGAFLEEALRDRFVCGLASVAVQRKLLVEENLSLKKAVAIAISMEEAEKQAAEITQKNTQTGNMGAVNKVNTRDSNAESCWRCGKKGHSPEECYSKNATCFKCKQVGHISRKCRNSKTGSEKQTQLRSDKRQHSGFRKRDSKVKYVNDDSDSDSASDSHSDLPVFTIKSVKCRANTEITVPLQIEGKQCLFELDTGASVSLISEQIYRDKFGSIELQPCEGLKTYSGESLPVLGVISVKVQYDDQCKTLPLRVVGGNGPSLFGRNWLNALKLDWKVIKSVLKVTMATGDIDCLLSKYNVFEDKLGTVKGVKAHLKLKENTTPVFYKPRPVPYALTDAISKELHRLVETGVLKKVDYSEWATPIVPVRKADGTVRICGDYKVTLNPSLEVPQYPIPRPQDIFTKLNGGDKFSKLDLTHAYQQVLLDEDSQKLVTINTQEGVFQYTRLPHGVSACPAVFQEIMDKILQGLPGVGCYMDDVMVTGKDDKKHMCNLENVLTRLNQYGIKLEREKCEFGKSSLEFLGFVIDKEGLHSAPSKVKAILEAKTPENLSQLESFLGLINFYGKFIQNMSTLVRPLNRLRQKGVEFKWTSECEQTFNKLKDILSSNQVLVHYDPDKELILSVDPSQYGVGAVIAHPSLEGERPIAYASRTLTKAEINYSQIEKEALAIIFGVRKFHQYLYGRKFTLVTDHKPLTFLLGPKAGIPVLSASRLQRWAIQLSAYTYDIKYRSSKNNASADALSRLPQESRSGELDKDSHIFWTNEATMLNVKQVNSLPVSAAQISRATHADVILSRVKYFMTQGWPTEKSLPPEYVPYYRRRDELTSEEGCLLWGTRVIVPEKHQLEILQSLHDTHQGIVKTKSLARLHVWWHTIDEQIELLVRSCEECQQVNSKPSTRSNPWIWPARPFQRIHIDYADYKGHMLLIIVDARSKWPEVIEMTSTTSMAAVQALRCIMARYGIPEVIISDNGPQFTSSDFKNFVKQNRIRHILSSPYHPSSNGEAERAVQSVKKALKSMSKESGDLSQKICRFLMSYRTTPHSTTRETPSDLFLGRRIRTALDFVKPDLTNTMQRKTSPEVDKTVSLQIGDVVLVRDYRRHKPKWTRGVILRKLSPVTYQIEVGETLIWKRHIDQIKDLSGTVMPTMEQPCQELLPLEPLPTGDNTKTTPEVSSEDIPKIPVGVTNTDLLNQPRRSDRVRRAPQRLIDSIYV